MELFNDTDSEHAEFLSQFEFKPHIQCPEGQVSSNGLKLWVENATSDIPRLFLSSKQISNKWNYFYMEIEVESKCRNLSFGFSSKNYPADKILGISKLYPSFGVVIEPYDLIVIYNKTEQLRAVFQDSKVFGIGIIPLTRSLFITSNGQYLNEMKIERTMGLVPAITLGHNGKINVSFSHTKFDAKKHINNIFNNLFSSSQMMPKVESSNAMILVKDYLAKNGYSETLSVLNSKPGQDKIPEESEKTSKFGEIRKKLLKENDWDLLLRESELMGLQFQANIILRKFLNGILTTENEEAKRKLFADYTPQMMKHKDAVIFCSEKKFSEIFVDLLNDNTEEHKDLINQQNKNFLLSKLFGAKQSNKLSQMINHLDKLLKIAYDHSGFDLGYDFANFYQKKKNEEQNDTQK